MDGIDDLHQFIKNACYKLHLLETFTYRNDKEPNVIVNGFELEKPDEDLDVVVDESQVKNGFACETALHHIMLKRDGIYHCAECSFETDSYTSFFQHCTLAHREQNDSNGSTENSSIYRCIKCFFLSLNFNGFKHHCIMKHKCPPHDVLQTVSWNNPNAEFYFQQFNQVAEGSKQKKNAMKLLTFYSKNKQKHLGCATDKQVLTNEKDLNSSNDKLDLQCLVCDFKCQFVYFLEEHYHLSHDSNGPERNLLDNLFCCAICNFKTSSYKQLHLHNTANHKKSIDELINNSAAQDTTKECVGDSMNNIAGLETTNVYMPESPPPSLDQQHSATVRLLHCPMCNFSTTSILNILNHWKDVHHREYPPFVAQRIDDDFKENVFTVNLPFNMVHRTWSSGWVNNDCTGLFKEPVFNCSQCSFSSQNRGTLRSHSRQMHPNEPRCNSAVIVTESPGIPKNDSTRRLCEKSTMLECSRCNNLTTCFYKDMLCHYKSQHQDVLQELSERELDNEIRSSVVTRCFKCLDFFCTDSLVLLEHYICDHAIDLPTFSIQNDDEAQFLAECLFCKETLTDLNELCKHLQVHRHEQLKLFRSQHVTAYCCSKCRRSFLLQRTVQGHYTRSHFDWHETDFTYDDFPSEFFRKPEPQEQIEPLPIEPVMAPPDPVPENFSDEQSICSSKTSESTGATSSYACQFCNAQFMSKSGCYKHQKRIHPFMDAVAQPSKLNNQTHLGPEVKSGSSPNDSTHSRLLIYTCSHHKYKDKTKDTYINHIANYHNEETPHDCLHCNRSYICAVVRRMHIAKKHEFSTFHKNNLPPSVIITSCSLKRFATENPSLYERHLTQKHDEKNPFHCPRCTRAYSCKTVFLGHLRKAHKLQFDDRKVRNCKRPIANKGLEMPVIVSSSQSKEIPKSKAKRGAENQSKDYVHAKSVKTREGEWKCLFCRKLLESYLHLRRHCVKVHPSRRVMRCRYCDYICRSNVHLSNHMRIHNKFVAQRMQTLREICKKNRLNPVMKERKVLSAKLNDVLQEADNLPEHFDRASPAVPIKPVGTAKKSIRSGHFCRKTIPKVQNSFPKSSVTSRHYFVTEHGTYRCRMCNFVSAEKKRLVWHLKSVHINGKLYGCKLCSFQHHLFDQMHTHLIVHHKMEKNHQLAIEMSVTYGGECNENKVPTNDDLYVPSNSFPVIHIDDEIRASNVIGSDDTDTSFIEREKEPGSLGSRSIAINDDMTFQCSYCDARFPSSYDAEYHMIRHERCVASAMEVDETAIAFSDFTSFLQPL